MSPEQAAKKSRRRFLADMLFLGGGLTAAAAIAENQDAMVELVTELLNPVSTTQGVVVLPDRPAPPCKTTPTPSPAAPTPSYSDAPASDGGSPREAGGRVKLPIVDNDPFHKRPIPGPSIAERRVLSHKPK